MSDDHEMPARRSCSSRRRRSRSDRSDRSIRRDRRDRHNYDLYRDHDGSCNDDPIHCDDRKEEELYIPYYVEDCRSEPSPARRRGVSSARRFSERREPSTARRESSSASRSTSSASKHRNIRKRSRFHGRDDEHNSSRDSNRFNALNYDLEDEDYDAAPADCCMDYTGDDPVDACAAAARPSKSRRLDISAHLSEDNHFEWHAFSSCEEAMAKEIISYHNRLFQNNEPFYQHKTSDFIVKEDQIIEVDTSCLFLNDDVTISTASMTLDDSSEDESIFSDDNYDTESETEAGNAPPNNIEDCNAVFDEPTLDYMYNVPVPKCRDPRTMSLTPISIAVVNTIGLV